MSNVTLIIRVLNIILETHRSGKALPVDFLSNIYAIKPDVCFFVNEYGTETIKRIQSCSNR